MVRIFSWTWIMINEFFNWNGLVAFHPFMYSLYWAAAAGPSTSFPVVHWLIVLTHNNKRIPSFACCHLDIFLFPESNDLMTHIIFKAHLCFYLLNPLLSLRYLLWTAMIGNPAYLPLHVRYLVQLPINCVINGQPHHPIFVQAVKLSFKAFNWNSFRSYIRFVNHSLA